MRNQGFTLIELSVVLFIVALLLGGAIEGSVRYLEGKMYKQVRDEMSWTRDALLGYAATKSRLPCPDVDGDGRADPPALGPGANCAAAFGSLPTVDLGLKPRDTWNSRFGYAADPTYSQGAQADGTPSFDLNAADGVFEIVGEDQASNAAVVFYSTGKDGAGDAENTDNDATFRSDVYTPQGGGGGGYDDVVRWIPSSILKQFLVKAGRLEQN